VTTGFIEQQSVFDLNCTDSLLSREKRDVLIERFDHLEMGADGKQSSF